MPARYLLIGSGVAAIAAAEAIRATDRAGDMVLVSDDPHGYYSRPGLAYYLTGEISRPLLFPFRDADWQKLMLRSVTGQVVRLDLSEHQAHLADGTVLPYDRLLLATGATAVRPELPGSELPEVVTLDSLADADRLLALARRARAAVVVGGGITALEIAEGLRTHCRRVHFLLRGERYWTNVLDQAESGLVMARLAHEGIALHLRTELASIEAAHGHVAAVLTAGGARIPCDLVAIAIGVTPRAELARAAGLAVDRGIVVNEHLMANRADVYAAGDVAQVHDPRAGKAVLDTLWNAAREQGVVAGRNMAGITESYRKPPALNVTRLAGLTTTIIGAVGSGRDVDLVGIARGDSEAWRQLSDAVVAEDRHEVNRLRLLIGQHTLVGAVLIGDQSASRVLQHLIRAGIDITGIRDQLLAPGAPLGTILTEYVHATQRA